MASDLRKLRQPERSALMAGRVGEIVAPESFPSANVSMAPDKYDYEGNWLFCSFDNPVIRAARIGFGQGRFRWEDHGLYPAEGTSIPLAYRIEVITQSGVQACLFSHSYDGTAVESGANPTHLSFGDGQIELFALKAGRCSGVSSRLAALWPWNWRSCRTAWCSGPTRSCHTTRFPCVSARAPCAASCVQRVRRSE